ncbi:hypothetical protein KGG73_gp55 [Streptomyces phage Sentinel]|uniref:Uncharacterized protein n=1 Tax=Streptomyces phage Sentinel TaxID=2767584 RepID=A0A873WEG2_9CAUD|nr:hypothetical protein KGG73_gp55 [Streptomyces phage Sentinel]QPB09889.1 hypothetical protein CPT_Sentinel_055 [Streptomyces phage Sentinel]
MSRQSSGWEYVNGVPRWAPTIEGAISELTHDKYGHEYEELHDDLMDIVRATQRDCADRLTEAGFAEAVELIFPDYPEED